MDAQILAPGIHGCIIRRTIACVAGDSWGTCYIFDRDSRRYIVTALHVVDELVSAEEPVLRMYQTLIGEEEHEVQVVGVDELNDIAVLATRKNEGILELVQPEQAGSQAVGLILGQEVFCVGYPFNQPSDFGTMGQLPTTPHPAIISGTFAAVRGNGANPIYVVGVHSARGMSGGPIAWKDFETGEWSVMGIVTSAIYDPIPTKDMQPVPTPSGFTQGSSIRVAEALIDKQPIGATIRTKPPRAS